MDIVEEDYVIPKFEKDFQVIPISALTGINLNVLEDELFKMVLRSQDDYA
jgi:hypothetical protein